MFVVVCVMTLSFMESDFAIQNGVSAISLIVPLRLRLLVWNSWFNDYAHMLLVLNHNGIACEVRLIMCPLSSPLIYYFSLLF